MLYNNKLFTRRMLHKLILGVVGIYTAYLSMSYLSEDL